MADFSCDQKLIVIGILGPPAGGKSTVASSLAAHGAVWINADRIAHYVLRMPKVKKKLRDYFGNGVFRSDGSIDRKRLGTLVFGDDSTKPGSLEYIESVVHPLTHQIALRRIERNHRSNRNVIILDAPLLIEANWHLSCDEVWYLHSTFQQRVQWAESRGWTSDQLRQREDNQLPHQIKTTHATHILDNTSGRSNLEQQIETHWDRIRRHCDLNARTAG